MKNTRKRKKNSKRKGSVFEREVAKLLSEWWNKKLFKSGKLIFWRTHSSGSISKYSDRQSGDITFIHEDGKVLIDIFVIECKRSRRFNLFGIIANEKIPLVSWLHQVKSEASRYRKSAMLIFKLDRFPIMMALDTCISKKLGSINQDFLSCRIMRIYKPFSFDFYTFDDFLKTITPDNIRTLYNKLSG